MDRFSKLFQHVIRKKIFYVYITEISTLPAICCYTTLWKSKIQKRYPIFTFNVTMCLTKIYCEILCNLLQKYRTNDFT